MISGGVSSPCSSRASTVAICTREVRCWGDNCSQRVSRRDSSRAGWTGTVACGSDPLPCDVQHHPYFQPGNNVTSGQLSKILVGAAGRAAAPPPTATFRDVPVGSPFFAYVKAAVAHGVVSGYACGAGCLELRPAADLTRAQLAKIAAGAVP